MTNGLDALRQKNKRAGGRTMPPPRHKPRSVPVEIPTDSENPTKSIAPTVQEIRPSTSDAAAAHLEQAAAQTVNGREPAPALPASELPKAAPPAPSVEVDELTKSTIYLDAETDQFLEEAIYLGRKQKPRIDSRSAIVRFALRELASRMSTEQVIAAIRAGAPETGNQGRPRL
ncbi:MULTISPECIES: hypothetical protein [Rhodococcus]|uniref:hypothetical protein n=1 Tax=Rhodococcus TaxID=1827 RepID=UPI000C9B553D|nr:MULTISPECIES: hypothetical protein [Rhodococcus]PND53468.1 hypothetical protein CQZ88_03170 [Rhodococcus sp. ENV425]QDC17376.1 hypothetical protein E2561_24630 [Rhodococcus ruber]